MFATRKRPEAPAPAAPAAPAVDAHALVRTMHQQAAMLGREAAEVRGTIDDTVKSSAAQAQAVRELAERLDEVLRAQRAIAEETTRSLQAVGSAGEAVQAVGAEVARIVDTLREVGDAASQISQIALQTRLVAFNASVEAKRAGEAGRGFGVVADAVKDLAGKVESSSKAIMGTMSQLDARVAALAREIRRREGDAPQGAVHTSLDAVRRGVDRIDAATRDSEAVCTGLGTQMAQIETAMDAASGTLVQANRRTETFLEVSEQLIELVAESGLETEDTPYIRAAQQAAGQIGQLLDDALRSSAISQGDLFDENYRPVEGSSPAQHTTRFAALADRLFPQVQDRLLELSDKVVFCIAVDRNGYVACHNPQYNHPQRPGDTAWNTAHCRNRRIFNDRTGLASGRNQRPFLLQTYRRDMGGGNFIVMKEVAAPITAGGRHWGGLRLAFRF